MLSLTERARTHTDHLSFISDDLQLTFKQLLERCQTLSAELGLFDRERASKETLDLAPSPFAFDANNALETCVLLHTLVEARATAFPLNPRLTLVERQALRVMVGARYLVRDGGGWSVAQTPFHDGPLGDEATDPRQPSSTATLQRQPSSTATLQPQLLVSTSGSTGVPKIVRLSRNALEASARANAEHLAMTPSDRWLLSLNLAHIGGISILLRGLYSAATVVIPPSGLSTEELAERVAASGITLLSVVPTQLKRILELPRLPAMPRLRAILVGGASCPVPLLEQARRRGLPVLATYGLSEAASQVTTQPLTDLKSVNSLGDSGLPLPQTELRVTDGVLEVRGPTLFDGYVVPGHLSERTLPLTPDGFFSTGDWGSLTSDGRFVALGRRSDRIVTGGENVSPVEVEDALLRLPNVEEVAVVGLNDPEWGQVVACAIVRKGGPVEESSSQWLDEMASKLRQSIAPFKCPKRWCVVRQLPHLPSGKLDRRGILKFFD